LKIQFENFGILVVTPKLKPWTQIDAKEILEKKKVAKKKKIGFLQEIIVVHLFFGHFFF
jgi:hypothetical protein